MGRIVGRTMRSAPLEVLRAVHARILRRHRQSRRAFVFGKAHRPRRPRRSISQLSVLQVELAFGHRAPRGRSFVASVRLDDHICALLSQLSRDPTPPATIGAVKGALADGRGQVAIRFVAIWALRGFSIAAIRSGHGCVPPSRARQCCSSSRARRWPRRRRRLLRRHSRHRHRKSFNSRRSRSLAPRRSRLWESHSRNIPAMRNG